MEVKSVLTASVTGTLPPKDGKNPEAYKITVVYSDGSKTVLRKTYPDFVDLQITVYTLLKEKGGYSRKTSRTLVSSLPELNSPLSRMLFKDSDLKKMERMDAFIKELLTLPTVVRDSENVRTFFGAFMEQQETSERSENEEELKKANKVAEMLSGRDPLRTVPEYSPVPSRKKSEYSDASWVPEDLYLLSDERREIIFQKLNERRPSKNIPPLPGKIRPTSTGEEVMGKTNGSPRPGLRKRPFSVAQAVGIADMLQQNKEFIANTSGSEHSERTVVPPSSFPKMGKQQVIEKMRMAKTDEDVMEKRSGSPRPGLRRRPFSVAKAVGVADMFKENEEFITNMSGSERSQSTVVPPISPLELDEQQFQSNETSPRSENSVDADCNEYNKEESRARKVSTQNGRRSPNRSTFVAISSFVAEGSGEVSLEDGEEVDVLQKESSGWWYVKNDFGEGWAPSAYLAPAQVSRSTSPVSQSENEDSREQSSQIEEKLDASEVATEEEKERGSCVQEKQKSLARCGGKGSQKTSTEMNRRVRFLTVEGIQKRKNPDKNYVYILKVVWSDGSINIIYRQCSDFFFLQESLRKEFPTAIGKEIPVLKGRKFTENCHFCFKDGTCKRRQFMNQFCHELINAPDNISKCQAVMFFCKPRSSDVLPHGQSEKNGGKTKETDDDDNVHISGPVVFEQYIVIADYKKKNTNDISLIAGETVDVIERNDLGWWLVDHDGDLGWAPASHLEPTDDGSEITTSKKFAPGKEEVYQSVQSYQAKAEDELSFDAGVMLRVVEKTLDGWWRVSYQCQEGWAPAMFLRKVASDDSSSSSSSRMDELDIVSFNGDSENSDGKRLGRTPPTRRSMVQRSVRRKPKRNFNPEGNDKPIPEEQAPSASVKKNVRAISAPARAATPPVTKRLSPREKLLSSPSRPRSSEFTKADLDKLNRQLSLSSGYGTSPSGSLTSLASDVFSPEENTSPIKKCATLPRFDHINDSEENSAPSPIPRCNSVTTMEQYKKQQESAVKDGRKSPIPTPRKISTTNRKSPLAGSPQRVNDLKMSLSQSGSDMESESGSEYRNGSESPRQKVSSEMRSYRGRQNEKACSLYRAMYTYIAQEKGEVNFNEGDVVEVIERSSNGWYLLNTQHGLGWGPSNFLQSEAN